MRHFRFISRFKAYQVSAMILLLAPLSYWYKEGVVSSTQLLYGYTAALGTTVVLIVLSYGFSRVIGELAFSPTTNTVCISTLTFLGYRRRIYYPLEHIVPYTDCQRQGLSVVQRLETLQPPCVYYYSLHYGHVSDNELLRKVLGTLLFLSSCPVSSPLLAPRNNVIKWIHENLRQQTESHRTRNNKNYLQNERTVYVRVSSSYPNHPFNLCVLGMSPVVHTWVRMILGGSNGRSVLSVDSSLNFIRL